MFFDILEPHEQPRIQGFALKEQQNVIVVCDLDVATRSNIWISRILEICDKSKISARSKYKVKFMLFSIRSVHLYMTVIVKCKYCSFLGKIII